MIEDCLDEPRFLYLAGPMAECSDSECMDWRDEATQEMKGFYKILNPMRRDYRHINKNREECNKQSSLICCGDYDDIRRSCALLGYCPWAIVGTSMEIKEASDTGKFVVLVVPKGSPMSPWYWHHANYLFDSLDEAYHKLKEFV